METRNYSAFRLSYRSGGSYGKTENIAKTRCFRTDTRIIPHNKLLCRFIAGRQTQKSDEYKLEGLHQLKRR